MPSCALIRDAFHLSDDFMISSSSCIPESRTLEAVLPSDENCEQAHFRWVGLLHSDSPEEVHLNGVRRLQELKSCKQGGLANGDAPSGFDETPHLDRPETPRFKPNALDAHGVNRQVETGEPNQGVALHEIAHGVVPVASSPGFCARCCSAIRAFFHR